MWGNQNCTTYHNSHFDFCLTNEGVAWSDIAHTDFKDQNSQDLETLLKIEVPNKHGTDDMEGNQPTLLHRVQDINSRTDS